uniref:Secretory carrier-associated membrane protein n=1 Tax=Pogona vitticeps TaxID=103695 RepID=A0ABM5ELX6_9SAUR
MAEKVNNFPPLPKFIPLKPCFYQDFADEIPIEHQTLVRQFFQLHGLLLRLLRPVRPGGHPSDRHHLMGSMVSGVAPVPSGGWAVAANLRFFTPNFTLLSSVPFFLPPHPPPHTRCSGWLAAVMFFSTSIGAAVIMLFPAIMFTLSALAMFVCLLRVHRLYRGGGGSFQKAQDEWQSGAWRNPPTREAQFNSFSGNTLPEYPTVPNYPGGGRWP